MGQIASRGQIRMVFVRWALVMVPLLLLLGMASGIISGSGYANRWFAALDKPAAMPPGWAFGVAWTILYVLMGLALATVLGARGARRRRIAIAVFVVQFVMNLAWSPLFFAAHQVDAALILIALLFIVAAVTAWRFFRIRPVAGLLLVPYLAWLLFAGYLNYEIARLNPDAGTLAPGGASTQISV
ncbi:MAG TPA: TspO/MBR family protein [Sphingomonadaceae bacterium]|nr:TspO/MBR family protein [Sphingomonadaceae bacterium]